MTELFSVRARVTSSDWTSDLRIDVAVWVQITRKKKSLVVVSMCLAAAATGEMAAGLKSPVD